MAHITEQRDQTEQQGVGRQQDRILADGVGGSRSKHAGEGMGIHERGKGRAERERRIRQHLGGFQDQPGITALCRKGIIGRGEYRAVAPSFAGTITTAVSTTM